MAEKKQKIFVGLSGGVDSSVAAALLVRSGYEVVGVFMQNWSQDFGGCCNLEKDVSDARSVADKLGIPFYIWNFEAEYQAKVLAYFFAEYGAGRTPNPDVMCNKEIKFKLFLERALKLGADKIATGHYARINFDGQDYRLLKGLDPRKDQSYFLCRLRQKELSRALFPLGGYYKTEARQLAKEFGLPTAAKKDSQGLCFVGQIDIREFLKTKLPLKPGAIMTVEGKTLGQHEGLAFYTYGQRKELGNLPGGPYYVVDKNFTANELLVSADPHDPKLWRSTCLINELQWVGPAIVLPAKYEIVIRYHHQGASALLEKIGGQQIKITFDKPERAITPGQLAVIFQGAELVGSGVINSVL